MQVSVMGQVENKNRHENRQRTLSQWSVRHTFSRDMRLVWLVFEPHIINTSFKVNNIKICAQG